MRFTGEQTEDGVARRDFEITVDGDPVPGCLWTPDDAKGPRPLILIGHGGGQHKKSENIVDAAIVSAREHGYATASIDAPHHGDRAGQGAGLAPSARPAAMSDADARWGATRELASNTDKVIAEWRATLTALQALDEIGADRFVGYWGLSMGSLFGVPFVAAEPRVTCAILGLFGVIPGLDAHQTAAERITVPLMFVFQWEDELLSREQGVALFNAFGSAEKTMHINPGGHVGIPAHERDAWRAFWARHVARHPAHAPPA